MTYGGTELVMSSDTERNDGAPLVMDEETNGVTVHRSSGNVRNSGARVSIVCQSVSKAGSLNAEQVRATDTKSRRIVEFERSCDKRHLHMRRMVSRGRRQMVDGTAMIRPVKRVNRSTSSRDTAESPTFAIHNAIFSGNETISGSAAGTRLGGKEKVKLPFGATGYASGSVAAGGTSYHFGVTASWNRSRLLRSCVTCHGRMCPRTRPEQGNEPAETGDK